MKKKLQLKKEIVSILDRNQMNNLTKAGTANTTIVIRTQKTECPTGWSDVCTNPEVTLACETMACESAKCVTEPCIQQTKHCYEPSVGCQPETDICNTSAIFCVTKDGCYCAASKDTCPAG